MNTFNIYNHDQSSDPKEKLLVEYRRMLQGHPSNNAIVANIAYALANSIPIPSTPVPSLSAYYLTTGTPQTHVVLDVLNEEKTINCNAISELCRTLWEMRYNIVHPTFTDGLLPLKINVDDIPPIYYDQLCGTIYYDFLLSVRRFLKG